MKVLLDVQTELSLPGGGASVETLVRRAHELGLHGIAVADRRTLAAAPALIAAAAQVGLEVGVGVRQAMADVPGLDLLLFPLAGRGGDRAPGRPPWPAGLRPRPPVRPAQQPRSAPEPRPESADQPPRSRGAQAREPAGPGFRRWPPRPGDLAPSVRRARLSSRRQFAIQAGRWSSQNAGPR